MRSSLPPILIWALFSLLSLPGCGGDDAADPAAASADASAAAPAAAQPAPTGGSPPAPSTEQGSGSSGSTSSDQGSTSSDQGSTSSDQGSTSSDQGSTSSDQGSTSSDQGSTSSDQGSTSSDQGSSSSGQGSGESQGSGSSSADMSEPQMFSEGSGSGSSSQPEGGEGYNSEGYSGENAVTEGSGSRSGSEYGSGSSGEYGPQGSGAPGAKPLTFADQAQREFQQGNDAQAMRLLHAHAVVADEAAAKELLDKMGFNAQLRRPALAVRWGIGIEYSGPPGYSGNIFPIGSNQRMPTRPGRAAGGETADSGGMAPTNIPGVDPTVLKLTGELGQKVIEQLNLRRNRGDYGEVLQSAAAGPTRAPGEAYGQPSYSGAYGSEGGSGSSGGYTDAPGGAGSQRSQQVRSMSPGVASLGVASTKEQLAVAKQAGVDALLVFKVAVALNQRAGLVLTDTDIFLYEVAGGKELFHTRKPLKNTEVQRCRAEGEDDGVAKTLVSLFETVDKTWRLSPLPAMEPPAVLDRVRVLLSGQASAEPLPALAEVRMYRTRGLLKEEHLVIAYQRLAGETLGNQLASGTEEEKTQAVQSWLNPPPVEQGPKDILSSSGS